MKRTLAWVGLGLALLMPCSGCNVLSAPADTILPPAPLSAPPEPSPEQGDILPTPRPLPVESLDELDEGSADGLTLDAAIDRLLAANLDLAVKYQDIPKARADVITAGLRSDPMVFMTASPIGYNRFSVQRPGATSYDITIVQSLDLSGKRKNNKRVAEKNIPILEARYQNAVRLEIDRLSTAFVNVLEARAVMRLARATLQRFREAEEQSREKASQGPSRLASLRRARAVIALQRAEAAWLHSRRTLALILAIPIVEVDHLRLRGTLVDRAPPPPCLDELIQLALRVRPDLCAHQLSIDRAQAELRREKAEALEDFFLFFSPYQALDNTPQGQQVANSWEMGVLVPIPSFNRNQGEIARARVNVVQWRLDAEQAAQQVVEEVRRALTEYTTTLQDVRQYERDILAHARRLRDDSSRRFAEEGKDLPAFLSAQRDYDETVRDYLEALARHRHAMLRLNTAVGQRILP